MREALARLTDRPDLLQRLASDEDETVKLSVAKNEHTPPEALKLLTAPTQPEEVRTHAAHHPNATAEILSPLINDESSTVRQVSLHHLNTPAEALQSLATNSDVNQRVIAGQHPNTPQAVINQLSEDTAWVVRASTARNPSSSSEVLKRLSTDPAVIVRRNTARNEKCPPAVLVEMTADGESEVREAVQKNPTFVKFREWAVGKSGIDPSLPDEQKDHHLRVLLARQQSN